MSSVGAVIAATSRRRSVDINSATAMPAVAGSDLRTHASACSTSAGAVIIVVSAMRL